MKITVETIVKAPIDVVWGKWTSPADIMQWNTASEDWHTVKSNIDLRVGGKFSSRMEAKDGSMGFDFAGTYNVVEKPRLIESSFDDRHLRVEFIQQTDGVLVRETFDAESEHPQDAQRAGWQAILDNFKRHVEAQAK